jgi:hypothetical protein
VRARCGRVPSAQSGPSSGIAEDSKYGAALSHHPLSFDPSRRVYRVWILHSSRIASSIWHGAVSGACEKAARAQDYAQAAEAASPRPPGPIKASHWQLLASGTSPLDLLWSFAMFKL